MLHFLQTVSKPKPTLGFHICLRSHLQECIILAFPTLELPLVRIWVIEYNNILTSNKHEIFIHFKMYYRERKQTCKKASISKVISKRTEKTGRRSQEKNERKV